jgi:hypothetical protein
LPFKCNLQRYSEAREDQGGAAVHVESSLP